MTDSADTGYPTEFQPIKTENEAVNPLPASKEEREAHFYARHAALKSGEDLKWSDERQHLWPKKDRINWVVERLAELDREVSECSDEEEKQSLETKRDDYNMWMLKERDGQSWNEIAQNRIEQLGIPKQESYRVSEALRMHARRSYERVERNHPGSRRYEPEPIRLENFCPNCGYPTL